MLGQTASDCQTDGVEYVINHFNNPKLIVVFHGDQLPVC